jgi:hypothetical protein
MRTFSNDAAQRRQKVVSELRAWEAYLVARIEPLQSDLVTARKLLSFALGAGCEGMTFVDAVRSLLNDRGDHLPAEEIATALLKAGYKLRRESHPRPRSKPLVRKPMTPEQKIVRTFSYYLRTGRFIADSDGRIGLPEWQQTTNEESMSAAS